MAALAGAVTHETLAGIVNPLLTVAHHAYTATQIPYESDGMRRPGGSVLIAHWPVEANGRPLAGARCSAWLDDYYYRIHLSLEGIDLGNVVSIQTTPVQVWNAWFEPRTLTAIDGLDEGITVSGQPAPPLLFAALQERSYDLSVTPDGTPVLDTYITWVFAHGAAPQVRVTANRIIGWVFVPDWAEGVNERLAWATDILSSESMVEQRRALRSAPRREFEATVYADGRERQYLDMLLFGWSARMWALPIFPDIQQIAIGVPAGALVIPCTTEHLDFRAGGLAMLRSHDAGDVFDAEVVEIDTIGSTSLMLKRATQRAWPAGTRLYPVRSAQLREAPVLSRITDKLSSFEVGFRIVEPSDFPAAAPALLYRGRPVLAARPDESQELTHEFVRLLAELDNGTAAAPLVTDVAGRTMPVLLHRWVASGRADRAAWRSLLYWLRGRQRALWVPTHADDLTLIGIAPETSSTIDVAYLGYTRFGQAHSGRRDIRIELADGTALHRRITGSTEVSGTVERMVLDAAHGVVLSPATVARISFMSLCRLDSDSVEIHHLTDSEGVAQSEILLRGVRDDEF
ncbi:hypothetical protein ACNQFN_18685 [Thauera butanivorans]|uniref:hypothetical protein n=1 Tax=Thauera butanivorans TaxID=86174 RepID=UPI003AB65A35